MSIKNKILVTSLGLNGLLILAYIGQAEISKRHHENAVHLHTWGKLLQKILKQHLENGGHLDVNEGVEVDIDAYLIMSRNGLL